MNSSLGASTVLFLVVTASQGAIAADWKPIDGTYAITSKHLIDPPADEAKDSHLRVQLTGDTARDLYRAMKVSEAADECTGATSKRVGEMQCLLYKDQKKYECHFGIDIMQQKIEYGLAC